jgi:hypothetical protein
MSRPADEVPRCAVCKRRLRHPSPTGLGPVCDRRLNGPPPAKPSSHRPDSDDVIPGQTELPLTDHQPTLWSL